MADRVWVKLWATYWTSLSHAGIGSDALLVGCVLMSSVRWQPGDADAWAVTESGRPIPVSVFATRAQISPKRAMCALLILEQAGTARLRDDGAWGMLNFGRYQETADAARKRKKAGKSGGVSGTNPDEEEAEADAEAASLREDTSVGSAATDETSQEALALSGEEPPTNATPPLIRHVLDELARAVRELKPTDRGPRDTPANRKLIAAATKQHALDPELWTLAIRRQLANVRGRRDLWSYLSLSTLCRPNNGVMARLLDAPTGGTSGLSNGRAEPAPRPTRGGTVDLKALAGGKSEKPCS